mgnify:CR=1 FL=1|jgi:short-subunit dehydrogenase
MNKIIIMGASSGIGLALAEAFVSRGVKIGVAARSLAPLRKLADKYPGCVEPAAMDVTDPEAPEHLSSLINKMGGMDLYIHVAGIGLRNPDMVPELEVKVAETDAVGLARMCSAAFRYFMDTGCPGQIAAVTSVAGTRGIGELAAYSASKSFGSTYLEALQQLAKNKGMPLYITDIRPGWTRTPFVDPDKKYMLEMQLSRVVPGILKAIAKRRRVAVIDWRWALVCHVWRLLPRSLWLRFHGLGL